MASETSACSPCGETAEWLSPAELAAWLAILRLCMKLPFALECQLQRDAGLSMTEYQVLAMLSERPGHTMRMSELAQVTNASLSRLSHLIKRLEQRELARREPDPCDGRFTNAVLTKTGLETLIAAAPGHVATVRKLVIDALPPERLRRLGQDAEKIVAALQPGPEH
jgi:DNA-binding MarR family transcriptional regulator